MIQKNDLRIGNKVNYKGNVVEIENFNEKEFNIYFSDGSYGGGYCDVPPHQYSDGELKDCEPIPLTEKWLLDLGFGIKEIYPKNEIHPKGWIIYEKDEFTITDDFRLQIFGKSVKIEYVHNLQNVYYAIERKELNHKI